MKIIKEIEYFLRNKMLLFIITIAKHILKLLSYWTKRPRRCEIERSLGMLNTI